MHNRSASGTHTQQPIVMRTEMVVTKIPGIGRRTGEMLETEGLLTVGEVRAAPLSLLVRAGLGEEGARIKRPRGFTRNQQ